MKTGRSLQELALELERQREAKRDFIAASSLMSMANTDQGLSLQINNGSQHESFGINDIAHRQIGSYLKIPAVYYERMRNEAPDLLTANVNNWLLSQEPNTRRMIRTLDGTARAFLSDRYRRIDNYEIATTVLPIIGDMEGASIESCELTDSRMYIKVVNPRIQAEVSKGDIVQAGVLITNSETGQGSVTVIFRIMYIHICSDTHLLPVRLMQVWTSR